MDEPSVRLLDPLDFLGFSFRDDGPRSSLGVSFTGPAWVIDRLPSQAIAPSPASIVGVQMQSKRMYPRVDYLLSSNLSVLPRFSRGALRYTLAHEGLSYAGRLWPPWNMHTYKPLDALLSTSIYPIPLPSETRGAPLTH